jgi:hypothetical protein
MGTRNIALWGLLSVCACLPGCTLLVDAAIDKKPAQESGDNDAGAGEDADAGSETTDSSMLADGGETESDGAAPGDQDASTGEDSGPEPGGAGKICVGYNHACGIDAAGKITCWGANLENQRTLPTDRTYLDVACGDYHTCAIQTNGALVCVGRNQDGQRVDQPGPFTHVTAGADQTCVINAAGTARCWGAVDRGQSTPPSEAFSALSAGSGFTCGIRKTNGALVCWGDGAAALMTQAAGKKLLSIDAGPDFVCGVTDTREGLCWGQNDYSISGLLDVQQIAGGLYSGCALLADDSVRCWYNGNSELIGEDDAPFAFVAVGGSGRCAVRKSGGVYCEPDDTSALVPGPDEFP